MAANIPAEHVDLALARSEFIDAYNAADAAVRAVLTALGSEPKQLLCHNIDQLSKLPAAPNYSKERRSKIAASLAELRQLQSVRCDLVHGQMEILTIDGAAHALFANVQKQSIVGRAGLLLTLVEMQASRDKLRRIATQLVRPALTEATRVDAAKA